MVFGTIAFTTKPGFYLFQVNNRNTKNTRARCKTFVKLTIMTSERRQWHRSGFFDVNFQQLLHIHLVSHWWLWESNCWLSRTVERNLFEPGHSSPFTDWQIWIKIIVTESISGFWRKWKKKKILGITSKYGYNFNSPK